MQKGVLSDLLLQIAPKIKILILKRDQVAIQAVTLSRAYTRSLLVLKWFCYKSSSLK